MSSGFSSKVIAQGVPRTSYSQTRSYIQALIDPSSFVSHIPTSFVKPSAIVQSILEFDIYTNYTIGATLNNGRFSFMVTPILGSQDTPLHYKVALVDTSAGWPTDLNIGFSQPAAYLRQINNVDIRVDPQKSRLTTPPPGYWEGTSPLGLAAAGPLGQMGTAPVSYALPVQVYNAPLSHATSSLVYLPPGVWDLNVVFEGPIANFLTQSTVSGLNCAISVENHTFNYTATNTTTTETFSIIVSVPLNTFGFQQQGVLFTYGAGSSFNGTTSTAFATVNPANPEFDQLVNPSLTDQMDSGYVDEMRVVACSVLCTNQIAPINAGGDICISYLPPESKAQRYLVDGSATGNFQYYQNLATTPGNYSGKVVDGAYAWWGPTDQEHLDFHSPTQLNSVVLPTICCSGIVNPGSAVSPTAAPGSNLLSFRVIVITTFEILSDQMFLPMEVHIGSQAIMDEVFLMLQNQKKCYPNGKHLDWIKGVLRQIGAAGKKAYKFYDDNKSIINPIAGAALSLL